MERNLTTGSIAKTVLGFSLPYLFSYFLQTLYGMADLYIIGRFNGVESTTAVSIGSQAMHMLTVMIVGLAMGPAVTIGQQVGGGKKDEAANYIGNTVTLFLSLALCFMVLLLLLTGPIVRVLSTPEEAVEATTAYLRICFLGIPFITAYNVLSSVFRGLGDSKSPLLFVLIACVFNIALDYLFIGALHMGTAGAALATTLSQSISVLAALVMIRRMKSGIRLTKASFRPQRRKIGDIVRIGAPIAFQDGFMQISFILVTVIANRRGLEDAAAVGIVEKLITFIFLVPSTLLSTVSAVGAQNIGAGKPERARQTLWLSIAVAVAWGVFAVLVMAIWKEGIIGLFTESEEVVSLGSGYMSSYILDTITAGIHFCFSGYFCAIAKSYMSFIHNALSICLLRLPVAYLASLRFPDTLFPMGLAPLSGSALSVLICLGFYFHLRRKEARKGSLG